MSLLKRKNKENYYENDYIYNIDNMYNTDFLDENYEKKSPRNAYNDVKNISGLLNLGNFNTKKTWKIINQSAIFLIFSLINSFFPIFICCIASLVNGVGAQVVMGIGYAATFQLSFAQLGVTFAISLFFFFNLKKKCFHNDNYNFVRSIFLTFAIGLISVAVYVVSSYLYLSYSNNRPNTRETIYFGLDFVYSSVGFCLLSSMEAYLFLLICRNRKYIASLLFLLRSGLTVVLCYLFAIQANLKAVGIGLGLTVGILVSTIPLFIYTIYKYHFRLFILFNLFPRHEHLFRQIIQESVAGISLSLAKGIAILCLNLLMTVKLTSYVPLSYQMARVIWFNLMYAIPWFGYGLSDAIKYIDLYNVENDGYKNRCRLIRNYWFLLILSMAIAALFAVGGYFTIQPLAKLYIRNSTFNGVVPTPEGLPENIQQIILTTLPPTYLPPVLPEEKALPTELMVPAYFWRIIHNNQEWKKWFATINMKIVSQGGISNYFEIITNWDALVLWFKNYVASTSYDSEIIKTLLVYRTPEEIASTTNLLIIMKFNATGFNAKAYIYICIYSILCSGWSVLLPASAVVEKKQFPPLLLALVYFLAVGFIIGFGATFSITNVATELGNNNPFQYLDAWTFPVAIVASVVFIYIFIKWTVISTKEYKEAKKQLQSGLRIIK